MPESDIMKELTKRIRECTQMFARDFVPAINAVTDAMRRYAVALEDAGFLDDPGLHHLV